MSDMLLRSSHVFTSSIMDVLVKDNVNPIEQVEKAVAIMEQTVRGQ